MSTASLESIEDRSIPFTERLAAKEFFQVYVPMLPPTQRSVIERYLAGETPTQIAAAGEGARMNFYFAVKKLRDYARGQ